MLSHVLLYRSVQKGIRVDGDCRFADMISQKRSVFLIQEVSIPIMWDQNLSPDLLESVMKPSRPVKEEL